MDSFDDFKITSNLRNALDDLGFEKPTPVQEQAFPIIMSGRDVVGIAQTGTGKTVAYLLPLLQSLPFSKEKDPRILILVPTRELVIQVVEEVVKLATYSSIKALGLYGGTNINTQKTALAEGADVVVATPGRLYDLVLSRALQLKTIKKLVIDEVDVMLDLGFRFQLVNIFELLPERRQNIMFSATMTDDIDALIQDFFVGVQKISIAVSGTPLGNIAQYGYAVPNFYTKVNLLAHLLQDVSVYQKVLVFVSNKRKADLVFEQLQELYEEEAAVIHSNKTQNYRIRSIKQFDEGKNRILITTDVMARGLDLNEISHVINLDTPRYPENYMHRIGRTGRADKKGVAILFYTEKEMAFKEAIETLMDYQIPILELPEAVGISRQLLSEERPKTIEPDNPHKLDRDQVPGPSFHEKSEKNKKTNQGGSYRRKLKAKYKKPKSRGDKNFNRRKKR
ncbi:DEAD/DEAH box helicase [Flavobacteriaceae bacterium TP-CH-4]|uniref:DEAD/DEAH box helicase n=1 Tax=Pelagihabitans pacificus TaxID=2696054 RepID=A0A967ARW8_9FLAO|nr:DEAD/DEAH box helicase [Pelagihabitans pacificus]NHF57808.1 DEAD/DEAH box helicase [Pelagihabitans pacificus]